MGLKTVVFDMDGLMIDSERISFRLFKRKTEEMGLSCDLAFYTRLLGVNEQHGIFLLAEHYGQDFAAKAVLDQIHKELDEILLHSGVPLKEGLLPLLAQLKKQGILCAVASSSTRRRVLAILEKANITEYFTAVVCGDEVARSKPAPDIFLKALEKTETLPQEALVLEDSEAGIQAAFTAGIPVICVPDMKVPAPEYAAKTLAVLPSLNAVTAWIQK